MGLNDNTYNISNELQEKNRLEKQKQLKKSQEEAERKKKIEEKENYKRLEDDIKSLLVGEFQKYFNICGASYATEFYSIERKQEILNDCICNLGEYKQQTWNNGEFTEICTNKKDIIELFDKHYYKILKEQTKIYELNDKYKYYKMLEEAETEQNQEKNKNKNKNNNTDSMEIIKTIFYLIAFTVFLPITFVFMLVLSVCKNSK